jgi:hypothetical protein
MGFGRTLWAETRQVKAWFAICVFSYPVVFTTNLSTCDTLAQVFSKVFSSLAKPNAKPLG